ncbi:MAG: glutaredoxin 3 [Polaribacter sp.]
MFKAKKVNHGHDYYEKGALMTQVRLYGIRFCPFCTAAKDLLSKKGVQYQEIPVDHDPVLRADIITKSGQRTVPQIWVGDTHVGGYSELQGLEANGELDLLLNGG